MEDNFNNKIPNWLNIALVISIFGTMLIGATVFLNQSVQGRGNNYEAFIPAGVCLGLYFLIQFVTILFSNADLASVMMIIFLAGGVVVLVISAYSKDDQLKSNLFHVASAVIGLALGIPFGEKLREERGKTNTRRARGTTSKAKKPEVAEEQK